MSFSLPVNSTIFISFVIFLFYVFAIHNLLTSHQENKCEMTFMFQYPQFVEISLPVNAQNNYPKYALYGYGEGGITEQLRKMKFKGIPVLFIPGSSGSHKQGRSLASISLRKSLSARTPFYFNYFMIDFNQEQSAFFGGVLEDQTKFAAICIQTIMALYDNNGEPQKPKSVILIGHSLGGLIAKGVFMDPKFDTQLVHLIISLATPHKYPLIQVDHYITSYYKRLNDCWQNNSKLSHISLISVGGGPKDIIVHSDVTFDPQSDVHVLTTAIPGVWLPNDHLSIMWCKQFILTLVRALFDSVDLSTKQFSNDKQLINKIFQYHFLKRSGGKRFAVSQTSRFSSFEKDAKWFENLQQQFTVTEPRGVKLNHYIMIRLFSDLKSEAAFIEGYNINFKDWIYVCSADLVHNLVRMCDTGENLSNLTEIAPVDLKLNLKRKFVYLNLSDLKSKAFTHVLVRLSPSDSFMSVNVDVHQPSERNINYKVPKLYSMSPEVVISSTKNNAGYYSIHLNGFEYIWQSFVLQVDVLSCKGAKNYAVASFIVPWANEDQHFIFRDKSQLLINLALITPKPKNHNTTSYPFVRFHLDPTCKYKVSIKYSIIGMFVQGARYYSLMLPSFLAAILILTLRQQIKCLEEGRCVFFHVALSSVVRRYYIILQVTVLGSKFLGLGFCLYVLPLPDFLILQEYNLDSFFMMILLYAVATTLTYSLAAAVYIAILVSGQAAHKMALRFMAKAISGLCNWFEWVVAALHQVPVIAAVILASLSVSTSGALGLWLGAFFYFLKLCKMYEEYLDEWFSYSIKTVAKKVKSVIAKQLKSKSQEKVLSGENKEETTTIVTQEAKELEKPESVTPEAQNSQESASESLEPDLLSVIHFHISVYLIWILIALLYTPSLFVWAKNYYFSISLGKDPALIPSIIVNACGAILWQPGVPKPCRRAAHLNSTVLFFLAAISIIYASFSVYRLGFILSTSLMIVSLNQMIMKYID